MQVVLSALPEGLACGIPIVRGDECGRGTIRRRYSTVTTISRRRVQGRTVDAAMT